MIVITRIKLLNGNERKWDAINSKIGTKDPTEMKRKEKRSWIINYYKAHQFTQRQHICHRKGDHCFVFNGQTQSLYIGSQAWQRMIRKGTKTCKLRMVGIESQKQRLSQPSSGAKKSECSLFNSPISEVVLMCDC